MEYAEKLANFTRTPEFHKYWLTKNIKEELDYIERNLNEANSDDDIEELTKKRDALREKLVKKIKGVMPVEESDTSGMSDGISYYKELRAAQ